MILTLDVGNSPIFGGVFVEGALVLRFRQPSRVPSSSDELGLFLRSVLRENALDPAAVSHIACCSVVPAIMHSLRSCCRKYFHLDPFVLQAGVKTGLKVGYRNPLDVGADRIANAIAATHLYPGKHLVIIDFGTATTIDVVRAGREWLGGLILPGLRIQMEALEHGTARLPNVEIVPPTGLVGRSTVECMQAGLFYGTRAAVAGITRELCERTLHGEPAWVIGTGGFSRLFERESLFDAVLPDLVLIGLERARALNPDVGGPWSEPTDTRAASIPGQ